MINVSEKVGINSLHKTMLQTVLYFDVFKYPITEAEIVENANVRASVDELKHALNELITLGYLKQIKDYYMPLWADNGNVERREIANAKAKEMMVKAFEYTKKVARLPFVRALCISGSLSKNYADDQSDVDFFVITKANRLWICRSLFIIFYKLLPKRKKKYYCLNYFISEADLSIDDKNIFVATELAYLIPVVDHDSYLKLLEKNSWYKDWYVNKPQKKNENCIEKQTGVLKSIIESLFAGKFGDWFDDLLLRKTANRWMKQFGHMDRKNFEIQFRSRKHSAKRHVHGFQNKVLIAFEKKLKEMESTFQLKLN